MTNNHMFLLLEVFGQILFFFWPVLLLSAILYLYVVKHEKAKQSAHAPEGQTRYTYSKVS